MGVLTDLVIADKKDAEQVQQSLYPAKEWNGIDAKGIDFIKLCKLRSILTGELYQSHWVKDFEFLAGDDEEGSCVFAIPDEITVALANLHGVNLETVAKRWHTIEEVQRDKWLLQDVCEFLKDFHMLALRAVYEKKYILMWISP